MSETMTNEVRGYCIEDPDGELMFGTLTDGPRWSKYHAESKLGQPWPKLESDGYSCVPVRVVKENG